MQSLPAPTFARPSVRTRSRDRGRTYEARVGQWLQRFALEHSWTLTDHPWLASPWGLCQPDFVLERGGEASPLIIEVKLTYTDCTGQAAKYKRAIQAAAPLALPPVFVQICRRLTPAAPPPIDNLQEVRDGDVFFLYI